MKKIKLGDVCKVQGGYAFKSDEFQKNNVPIIRIGNIQENKILLDNNVCYTEEFLDNHPEFEIKKGDILIAMSGATVGKIGVYQLESRALLNQRVGKFIITSELDKRYLYFLLQSPMFENFISNNAFGCAQPNISSKKIEEFEFYNYGLEKQKEIVTKLDKIQEILDARKKQIENLDGLIKSQFHEMFGEPLVNQKGFEVLSIEDVLEFQGGAQPDKKYFEYTPTDENIRLIQIRDYKSNGFITYIPRNMAKRFCDEDDIMIGRYGPPIFQILQGIKGSYNVALMKAIPKKGNKEFLRHFLKQECLLRYLEGLSQRTAGQAGIDMPKLKKYPLPYPPIELQNQFAKFVELIDKQKLEIQRNFETMKKLQGSLMNKYFN